MIKRKKVTGGQERTTNTLKPNRAPTKAEELVGEEGQQPGPGAKANTVPKRGREGGREKPREMVSRPLGTKTSSLLPHGKTAEKELNFYKPP